MDWKNKDMKHLFVQEKYDWQPWIVATGIWILYVVGTFFLV